MPLNLQNFRDYYEILGVSKEASYEEIRKAYRKLALQYHPDRNQGNEQAADKFKAINEAKEVLLDETRRAKYDEYSRHWKQKGFTSRTPKSATWGGGNKNNRSNSTVDPDQFSSFDEFINQVIGVGAATQERTTEAGNTNGNSDPFRNARSKVSYNANSRPQRRDIEARLTIPLSKAYQGGLERIRLEDGRSLEVNMPAGMVTGQTIRLRDQGINGGDLYLKITVEPNSQFKLEGLNILCQVPVTPSEAVLGGQIEAPTLDGPVKMSIPAGVRSGQRFRLANKGYPNEAGKRGDQLVEIQIVTPRTISQEERELYEKLRQIETFKPRADLL
jgi:curved DNA-binding protein